MPSREPNAHVLRSPLRPPRGRRATHDDSTVRMTYDTFSRAMTTIQGGDPPGTTVTVDADQEAEQDADTSEIVRLSFHTQLIGSVTQVTGPSGGVVESYEYDPYGKPTIKDGGGSTITASAIGNSRMFTARQWDEETGLYHYRARAYSPELRRFIQRDPLEYVDGPNAVAYAGGATECGHGSARTRGGSTDRGR
ncbi:MAG: RHS repeat-associated core domain-containing protein [Phycisphaerales bacterium]|nr:RHS repeat-associated core domain-containing protein [Phycisphaerales bacterium]